MIVNNGVLNWSTASVRWNNRMLLVGVDCSTNFVLMIWIWLVLAVTMTEMIGFKGTWILRDNVTYTSFSHCERGWKVRHLILCVVKVRCCASLIFRDNLVCARVGIRIKSWWSQCWCFPLSPNVRHFNLSCIYWVLLRSYCICNTLSLGQLREDNLCCFLWINQVCGRFCNFISAISRWSSFSAAPLSIN